MTGAPNKILSIITITYNNEKGLCKTLSSISLSTEVELIIINGGDDQETLSLLNKISSDHTTIISEPDNGIYDAMNKGLKVAKSDYVIFMNAGDCFFQQQTISSIVSVLSTKKPDVLYGETMHVNEDYEHLGLRSDVTTRKLPDKLSWKSMINGMLVCHQSFIVKRTNAPYYIIDNLSADIDWQIKCLKRSQSIIQHPDIISQYLIGGTSKQRHFTSLYGRFRIMQNHYGFYNTIIAHIRFVLRSKGIHLASSFYYATK